MRRQVEDDIHVRLIEPEIQAGAVKVEEPAQVTSAPEVSQLVYSRVVLESMAGHKHDASGSGGINVWQGILDVRVHRDAVLRLPTAVTYLSKPPIDADNSGYPGCSTKHPNVPRTPVPHPNDADPDSLRSRPHIPPPAAAIPRPRSLRSFSLISEASLIAGCNGTPA